MKVTKSLMRLWHVVALIFFGSVGTANAGVDDKRSANFAGIAFTTAATDVAKRLPYVSNAIERAGIVTVNASLRRALTAVKPKHFALRFDELGSLDGSSDALVMAIAIDRETVVVEAVAGQQKLLYELAAQALFFDFKQREVLFAYPITLQIVALLDAAPTNEDIQRLADDALAVGKGADLATTVAGELVDLTLPNGASRRLQVTEVRLSETFASRFPDHDPRAAPIGEEFSKIFASTLRLPMLPYAGGQAIGGTMAARIADGSVFNLKIPAPDYVIALEVDDVRDKTLKETPAFRQQLYGSFFKVRVVEPVSGKAYFDQSLRFGATKLVPASQTSVDAWAVSYETVLGGFSALSQAAAGSNQAWSHEQNGKDFTSQLKSLQELIQSCR